MVRVVVVWTGRVTLMLVVQVMVVLVVVMVVLAVAHERLVMSHEFVLSLPT